MAQAHVYVISAGDSAVKIGLARDPQARMRDLQTGHYERLTLSHVIECDPKEVSAIERRAHVILSAKRLAGEWFKVGAEEAKAAIATAVEIVRHGIPDIHDDSLAAPTRDGKTRSKKPWHERWKFSPLDDGDFEAIRFFVSNAAARSRSDSGRTWTVDAGELQKVVPMLKDEESFDAFHWRNLDFWFDYGTLPLKKRGFTPGCYPKSRVISELIFGGDFGVAPGMVEYQLCHAAVWIVTDLGVSAFMDIIRAQSDMYRLKEKAA